MTLQELEAIKQSILSEHCMDNKRKAPRITVAMGTCGIKAGAVPVLKELEKQLAATKKAVVTYAGCSGLCSCEPVVTVSLPGEPTVTYGFMSPEKARTVVREHILGGKPVAEWVVAGLSFCRAVK